MNRSIDSWEKIRLRQNESGLAELYHENTKRSKYSSDPMTKKDLLEWADNTHHCIPLPYKPDGSINLLNEQYSFAKIITTAFKHLNITICPIELFIHIPIQESGLLGLYHYDKEQSLHLLSKETTIGLDPIRSSILLTCTFEKVVVPYGERGYRKALMNCGQIIQNMNLSPGCSLTIDETYSDYEIEEYLNIDGVNHSIIEVILINNKI